MNGQENLSRRLELSSKLIEMGQALLTEGTEVNDYTIIQSGNFMILIGSLMFDEEDIYQFAQLCSMFSAKKILSNMEKSKSDFTEFLKHKTDSESYDEFIKRVRKINGETPE